MGKRVGHNEKSRKMFPLPAILATILVIAVWCSCFVISACWKPTDDTVKVFEIVNVLFTGLAFVGLIWTMWFQRRDLKEQSKDQHADRIRSRLWGTLPIVLELYNNIAPEKHFVTGMLDKVKSLPRERNQRAIGNVAMSYIVVSQAFVRLSVFCDLVLSYPEEGFIEDRRALGSIIVATIGLDRLPLLVEIGMRTDKLAYMSLIYFLYKYGDLEAGVKDDVQEQQLIDENMRRFFDNRIAKSRSDSQRE